MIVVLESVQEAQPMKNEQTNKNECTPITDIDVVYFTDTSKFFHYVCLVHRLRALRRSRVTRDD